MMRCKTNNLKLITKSPKMVAIAAALADYRQQRLALQRWRTLQHMSEQNSRELVFAGKRYLNFASNDYLGLATHPAIITAYTDALQQYGVGGRSSPLVSGWSQPQQYLAAQLSEWLEREAVLLFSSGFSCNQGVLRALAGHYQQVHADRLIHASCYGETRLQRFPHLAIAKLISKLSAATAPQLVITESVFSMDGDQTSYSMLAQLAQQQEVDIWVDDAHGIGVLGEQGKSAAGALSQAQLPYLTVTFGKGLGNNGAAFATTAAVADYLINQCRDFIYSTALAPAQAAAVSAAVNIVQSSEGDQLRAQLNERIAQFQQGAKQRGLAVAPSATAIQYLVGGAEEHTLAMVARLQEQGIYSVAIRPPTVPAGQSRIRLTLTSRHQASDIEQLLHALQVIQERYP